MTRIRSITAAGVIVGATVLGGAGLAAADDHDTTADPAQTTDLDGVVEIDENGDPIDAATLFNTGEAEDPAGDEAETTDEADEVEDADDAEKAEAPEAEADTTDAETVEDGQDAPAANAHGKAVSETARTTEPGPDHGPTVAEQARAKGEDKRAERQGAEAEADDAQDDEEQDDVDELDED